MRAKELASDHLADRTAAKIAYHGQTLHVSVPAYVLAGKEIQYFVFHDGKERKPVIVFRFDEAPEKLRGTIWIEGTCEGCIDDKEDRGIPGYTFTVTLTRCRIIPAPKAR